MKVVHWTLKNNSGMNRVAQEISDAERKLGVESLVLASDVSGEWEQGAGADVHIAHSHVPDRIRLQGGKTVWIGHGTPEHCFQHSVEKGLNGGYGHSDTWMLIQWWLQHADALVTFWPRHQWIYQSLCDRGRKVHCLPLGINRRFWQPQKSRGKFAGNPSLFTAENCHYIKWPLDLFIAWPEVIEHVPEAHLHAIYLPRDQHRWFFPLINRNGAAYKSYVSPNVFGHEDLRNAFCSIDYYVNLVRYGDYNRVGLEAKACGAKVISYAGNPYADFWLTEGDQRKMAEELRIILTGAVEPLQTIEPPDIMETAQGMLAVYGEIV